MKIVKSKEDIKPGTYCKLTRENYEKVKELGYNVAYDTFDGFLKNPTYKPTDVISFYIPNVDFASWESIRYDTNNEFQFREEISQFDIRNFGFIEPANFKAQIFTQYKTAKSTEYIGSINGNIPVKWDSSGICLNLSSEFNLFKEYKQRIYTKPNSHGFFPKQKFKISWTEAMSRGLEESGWILATNEEIDELKIEKKEITWNGTTKSINNLVKKLIDFYTE